MKKPFVLISAAATLILLIGAAALLMGYVHTPPQPRAVQTFDAADEVGGFEAALEERTAGEAKYIRKLYSVQAGELPRSRRPPATASRPIRRRCRPS